jgi:16S rRNA (cytosine1402-N4)-methyltransferase
MLKESFHTPVLTEEIIELLIRRKDGVFLDATSGFGGHSGTILNSLEKGSLFATDQDPDAINHLKSKFENDTRIKIQQACFSDLRNLFSEIEFDGILADIGVSSYQLDNPERGFSFNLDGPLDMRMNQEFGLSASSWINNATQKEISDVIWKYGEEKRAKRISKIIVQERQVSEIVSTKQLADIILEEIPRRFNDKKHPATQTFQGIRIFINNELKELELLLDFSVKHLKIGGRMCIVSFHSLEDRLVKRFFRDQSRRDPRLSRLPNLVDESSLKIVSKMIKPSNQEVRINKRARSARLRVAERIK